MKKKHYLYWISIGVLSALLTFQTCSKKQTIRTSESNILAINSKIEYYKSAYNQEVASKKSIILQRDNFKFLSDSLRSVVKNFKKVDNIIEIETVFETDTVYTPLIINPNNVVSWKYEDDWIIRSGRILNKQAILDPITITNNQDIVVGQKKIGLFKPKEYTIDITNSNPYIKTTGIQHYTVIHDKKWYEKWWIVGPIGIGAGALIFK